MVELDGRTYSAYRKSNVFRQKEFIADVSIDFSDKLRVAEDFILKARLVDAKGKVIHEKSISVNVKRGGKLEEIEGNGVSFDQLRLIFEGAKSEDLGEVVSAFNEGLDYFEINNCLRKAHFFAQALKEVGSNLAINGPEDLNYPTEALINGSWYSIGTDWMRGNKEKKIGGFYKKGIKKSIINIQYTKKHPNIAILYGRKDLNKYKDKGVQAANEEMLANYIYGGRIDLGNRGIESGDGYKFLGRGIIQLTGRYNYTEVNKVLQKFEKTINIIENPDSVFEDKRLAVLSAMAFWKWKRINEVIGIDKADEVVNKVSNIVNSGEDAEGKALRLNYFKKIKNKFFDVDNCKL